jgi:NAD(P)-dependent dehydrogenase (short-subunit alcohol dehydrogenase family)
MPSDPSAASATVPDASVGFATLLEHRMRVAAVTGAGSGIGRAIAHGLAAAGYRVAILGRRMESLTETARRQPGITPFGLDVADASRSAAVLAEVDIQLGPVDILVANAAIYPRMHFLDQSPTSFEETMQINVHGVANVVRAVLPGMLARNAGRVIVMGSLADQTPLPGSCAYSVSKGALHALVRGIAAEIDRVRYPDVLVNELIPGATRTAMSTSGQLPEAVYPLVQALIDQPSGGAHGRIFVQDREVRPNEGPRRMLLRRLRLSPGLLRLRPSPSGGAGI